MRARLKTVLLLGAAALLAGCMEGVPALGRLSELQPVALFKGDGTTTQGTVREAQDTSLSTLTAANAGTPSPIISALQTRRSVLTPNSPYAQVAQAVIATSSGVAEAELRASKLRAIARSKNWLPTIGPSISLNALGELAAGLLVEQVIYDNGKRRAERAFAAADVEVSAVALSQDVNDRLAAGLTLYLSETEAREKAQMAERGLGRMREFDRVVTARVSGGLSSLSDQRVVRSAIAELEQETSTHFEAAESARAELASLTGYAELPALDQAIGIGRVADLAPLDVVRAEAEAVRAVAEAQVERAGLKPALTASGLIGTAPDANLTIGGAPLGFGTQAEIEASRAREAAAKAQIAKARETAARREARLTSRLTALQRQERDAADLVQQTRANYRLFQDQFEAGQKTVMDVMNVYRQMIREELKHIDLKYEIVLTQLELARASGALANGADI